MTVAAGDMQPLEKPSVGRDCWSPHRAPDPTCLPDKLARSLPKVAGQVVRTSPLLGPGCSPHTGLYPEASASHCSCPPAKLWDDQDICVREGASGPSPLMTSLLHPLGLRPAFLSPGLARLGPSCLSVSPAEDGCPLLQTIPSPQQMTPVQRGSLVCLSHQVAGFF